MEKIEVLRSEIDHIEHKKDVQLVVMSRRAEQFKPKIWVVTAIEYTTSTAILTLATKGGVR